MRVYSRSELLNVAAVFTGKKLEGNRLAVVTHAGGPGVMLTDALAKGGMVVPKLEGPAADDMKSQLFHGASVANPIDILATGTPEQLAMIFDKLDNDFDDIDGTVVIFGTPGTFDVTPAYDVIWDKKHTCKKPIYSVMPSTVEAKDAVEHYLALGGVNIADEVDMGNALAKVYNTAPPADDNNIPEADTETIRNIIDKCESGYLEPNDIQALLDAAGIARAQEIVAKTKIEAIDAADKIGFPVVMKVVGPVHKSDVGGVELNITSQHSVTALFDKMMAIEDATGVIVQPMLSGLELFAGVNHEDDFGHMILCGLGGIFIEVLKDVSYGLSPLNKAEALTMIKELNAYDLIKGVRGQDGTDENKFADIIVRLSALCKAAPEIRELDLNPLLGKKDSVVAVDARIRIEK